MNVFDYVDEYARHRRISPKHLRNLRLTARCYGGWAQDGGTIEALTEAVASDWLIHLETQGLSDHYLKSHRGNLLSLWNDAADRGLVRHPVTRLVRSIRCAGMIPTASRPSEIAKLLDACCQLRGCFQNYPIVKARLMAAYVLVCWDTAMRPWSDVLRIQRSWIGADGQLVVAQHKTAWPHNCRLRPETVAAIDATFPPDRRLIFEPGYKAIYYNWGLIRDMSGVRIPPKQIRASRGTDAERQVPGSAPQVLGHKPGSQVAYRHYVDPRLAYDAPPLPPPLRGTRDAPDESKGSGDGASSNDAA